MQHDYDSVIKVLLGTSRNFEVRINTLMYLGALLGTLKYLEVLLGTLRCIEVLHGTLRFLRYFEVLLL